MSVDSVARGLAAKASQSITGAVTGSPLYKIARSPSAFTPYVYASTMDAPPYGSTPLTTSATLSGSNFGSIILNPSAIGMTVTLPTAVADGGSNTSTTATSGIWVEFWNISAYMITISCATGQVFHNSNAQTYQLGTHTVMKICLLQSASGTPLICATALPMI